MENRRLNLSEIDSRPTSSRLRNPCPRRKYLHVPRIRRSSSRATKGVRLLSVDYLPPTDGRSVVPEFQMEVSQFVGSGATTRC